MLIGYARVSTDEQNLDLQLDALTKAGCEKIITDKISSTKDKRKGLDKLNDVLREGDTLIIWRLDRLFCGLLHLLSYMPNLEKRKITLKSLNEEINTSTPAGKLNLHFLGALNEFRINIIRQNCNAGLAAARARGRVGGRKYLLTSSQVQRLKELYNSQAISILEICNIMKISKTTLYRYVKNEKKAI